IPTYGEVQYKNAYPGINVLYQGVEGELQTQFVVAPGANPGAITLNFPDDQAVSIDSNGELVLTTPVGNLVLAAPVMYQQGAHGLQAVKGSYVLEGGNDVGF